uniref:Uncharacterized protein n=1 Tax=Setaria viridis TaxID=4556 RepID=A0A4U6TED7_SETVI|nr:hypothetical protein SEVIR_8G010825v2 [Setaria viridis]
MSSTQGLLLFGDLTAAPLLCSAAFVQPVVPRPRRIHQRNQSDSLASWMMILA